MNKTAVIFSPIYFRHDTGKNHPESALRLQNIINQLKQNRREADRWRIIAPERASLEDIQLVHAREYVNLVEAFCREGGGLLDLEDTVVSPQSYDVALYAVGGAIKAVDLVMEGTFQNAMALIRPPGHHASRFRACGFCIFNNVAVAAKHLQRQFKLDRIAILDIDAHHGNGTQEAFYDTDEVLYISLHEDPSGFPGTGFAEEIGEGKGLGFTVNVPLPYHTNDFVYLEAAEKVVKPILSQYRPQFILVSSGFDGHYSDPVGNLSLSSACYRRVYEMIFGMAAELCQGRMVAILEGGYSLNCIGGLAMTALATMCGIDLSVKDNPPPSSRRQYSEGMKIIDEVRSIHNTLWEV